MGSFAALSPEIKGFAQLWATLLVFAFVFELIRYIQIGRIKSRIALAAAETVLAAGLQQALLISEDLPRAAVIPELVGISVLAAAEFIRIGKWQRKNLSFMSVKDSLDSLPAGLCFYWEGGLPELINRKMDSICRAVTGEALLDAQEFWRVLCEGEAAGSVRAGDTPIVRLDDETAYSFVRYEGELYGKRIYEIIASDITEEYRLTRELDSKKKQADVINARLRALNSSVQYLIMDKEILNMKVRLHDSFGKTLLMTREYMIQPEAVDKAELLDLWRTNIMLLKNEESEKWQQPYFVNIRHAQRLGVRLVINGRLPEDEPLIPVIDSAITVHVTNVLRHAEGDTATITATETEDRYVLSFTNNGIAPKRTVTETGGLANLRRMTEELGGEMSISSRQRFELMLMLPKKIRESERYGSKGADSRRSDDDTADV